MFSVGMATHLAQTCVITQPFNMMPVLASNALVISAFFGVVQLHTGSGTALSVRLPNFARLILH